MPNEWWQADVTHVALDEDTVFEVLNMVDDCSRLCVASRAFVTVKSADVTRTLHRSAQNWGYPAAMLTDNGLVFTAQGRYGLAGAFEQELFSLGIATKHSRPYHPQTCGKIERFHQTMKHFLAAQKDIHTKKQLQGALDRFVGYYNEVRPHRGIDGRRPIDVYRSMEKVRPTEPLVAIGNRRVRQDKVSKAGNVTIRYKGQLHHVGVGHAYAGWRVIMLVEGRSIEIVALDGSPLRRLVLDPKRNYQPQP